MPRQRGSVRQQRLLSIMAALPLFAAHAQIYWQSLFVPSVLSQHRRQYVDVAPQRDHGLTLASDNLAGGNATNTCPTANVWCCDSNQVGCICNVTLSSDTTAYATIGEAGSST